MRCIFRRGANSSDPFLSRKKVDIQSEFYPPHSQEEIAQANLQNYHVIAYDFIHIHIGTVTNGKKRKFNKKSIVNGNNYVGWKRYKYSNMELI